MAGAVEHNHIFLLERSVVGLMRLASRLMRREEISSMVKFQKTIFFPVIYIYLYVCSHLGIAVTKCITNT